METLFIWYRVMRALHRRRLCFFFANDKFLFLGTNGKYVIGTLDDNIFLIESEIQQFAYGETYSSQTWNYEPNDKHIMIFRLG